MSNHDQATIVNMFDDIAGNYDRVNRILSFGMDKGWRSKMANFLLGSPAISILDVATGTADVLIAIHERHVAFEHAVGVDASANMLDLAQQKITQRGLAEKIRLIQAQAGELPFADHSFDVVTIAFGIRNVVAEKKALGEIMRVLKPQGRLVVLEFSMPRNPLVRRMYQLYFRHILPFIGGILSRNQAAYRYLNRSVEQFPSPDEYRSRLLALGFSVVEMSPLSFGVATIFCARKG